MDPDWEKDWPAVFRREQRRRRLMMVLYLVAAVAIFAVWLLALRYWPMPDAP